MVSAMTGEFVAGPELDAGYWYASLRSTVQFARATEVLGRAGYGVFIETSAHPVLTSAIGETLEALASDGESSTGPKAPVVSGTLRRDDGGPDRLLASLAEVQVRGAEVDWAKVLPSGRRVTLPTYAFQRQRYWPKPRAVARRERGESAIADWRYRITWTPLDPFGPTTLTGTWLIITPAEETHRTLAADCHRALTHHGARVLVTEVPVGNIDRSTLADQITNTTEEYRDGLPLAGIVSLLAGDLSSLERAPVVPRGLASTMSLVQALGDTGTEARLWVLTSAAVAATSGEVPPSPLPAQSWAFGRVVGLEHPHRWGGLIDLPTTWDSHTADQLVAVLAGRSEDQVAIRPNAVLGRRLIRATAPVAGRRRWAPGGSVLVTGGTGGVGGHVARWLTGRDAAQVVLTSRSGPNAVGAAALAAELATAGTDAAVLAADVGDRAQAAGLLSWIDTHGPGLSSILHAAGAGGGGPVSDLTVTDLTAVFAAKVGGARNLDELTTRRTLDAFVMFSSGAATWGSTRLSGYAAANAALDALIEDRRARGLAGTSIAWGLWGGGGMGEGPAGQALQRLGVREMDPRAATSALGAALDAGDTLVAVSDIDWERFTPIFTVQRPSPLLADLPEARQALADTTAAADDGAEPAGTPLSQRLEGLSRVEQERVLTDLVRAEAAAVLGYSSVDAVPAERAFKDLGFDSLTAVDLRTRLNTATGLKLPATLVFDYPTPMVLADFVRSKAVDEQTDYAIALAELKKLQGVLSRIAWNSEERFDITSRLESIGQELRAQNDDTGADQDFESATDDEMFDFVEKELRAADLD
jgi:candicidin polyketide synthase FscD